jgi:hypothetical protein
LDRWRNCELPVDLGFHGVGLELGGEVNVLDKQFSMAVQLECNSEILWFFTRGEKMDYGFFVHKICKEVSVVIKKHLVFVMRRASDLYLHGDVFPFGEDVTFSALYK